MRQVKPLSAQLPGSSFPLLFLFKLPRLSRGAQEFAGVLSELSRKSRFETFRLNTPQSTSELARWCVCVCVCVCVGPGFRLEKQM
jgi:hypothetical protein